MNKKRFLWLGPYSTESVFNSCVSRGYRDAAAHNCQRNFITGFIELGVAIDTISTLGVRKEELGIFGRDIASYTEHRAVDIVCCTGKKAVYNRPLQSRQLLRATLCWLQQLESSEQPIIFVYSMQSLTLGVIRKLKAMKKSLKVVLVVPDLPQFMDLNMSRTKAFLKAIDWQLIRSMLNQVDYFLLFSAKMADFLQLSPDNWCVIEGCAASDDFSPTTDDVGHQRTFRVAYTGGLHLRYGIRRLLEAAKDIQSADFELVFSGDGDAVSEIEEASRTDPRISYVGFLPDKRSVAELQSTASALINLRQPDEQASQYCFPSKLFEYMLSSKPVITWRIGGIPDEYFNYLVEIPNTSPKAISYTIQRLMLMPEADRRKIGHDARSFILRKKTPRVQIEKLINSIGWLNE